MSRAWLGPFEVETDQREHRARARPHVMLPNQHSNRVSAVQSLKGTPHTRVVWERHFFAALLLRPGSVAQARGICRGCCNVLLLQPGILSRCTTHLAQQIATDVALTSILPPGFPAFRR